MARLKVFALSVVMETGLPRLAMNLRRHLTNASVERSAVSSRCNALEVAQVNKQMYAFFICFVVPPALFTYTGPAKSTSTWVNAGLPEALVSGRSAVSSGLYSTPSFFLQMTH